jgi:hypothetical protein
MLHHLSTFRNRVEYCWHSIQWGSDSGILRFFWMVQKYKAHKCKHYFSATGFQVKVWEGNVLVGSVRQTFSICRQLLAIQLSHNIRLRSYRSLNVTVAQSKNGPFRVNTRAELKNITTYFKIGPREISKASVRKVRVSQILSRNIITTK